MKIHFLNLVLFVVGSLLGSCNSETRMFLLKKDKIQGIEIIEYSSSKKFGSYINLTGESENINYHYNIKFTSNGTLLHVIKYDNYLYEKEDENLELDRTKQLLVTDTSIKNNPKIFYDPNFFGNSVNGYYSNTMSGSENNLYDKINRGEIKSILTPISTEEKRLFTIIDSLTKSKSIKYIGFDTSKVLGWFKYVF